MCPTVSQRSSGCEMNRVGTCGDCTFWVDGLRGWMLFKTVGPCTCSWLDLSNKGIVKFANDTWSDMPNLQILYLHNNKIAELGNGTWNDLTSLDELSIFENPLGCVSGIADDVEIDGYALMFGFYETPLCPDNCTINTNYDPDNHVCLSCPENTYTDGIGAVNCTALSVMPTTATALNRDRDVSRTSWHKGNSSRMNRCIWGVS